jgi:hypothetical protein
MDALDKLKKKNAPQVSVALMRMKPMSRKEAVTDSMSYRDDEGNMEENGEMREMSEDKEEYGSESCPKCAEYQMLIGEAITTYMRNKDKEEASDSEME